MKITTLWERGAEGDMPWLVSAYDEYTEEEHNGEPEFFRKERLADPKRRVLIIEVPDQAVTKLFQTPKVQGKAVEES